MSREIRFDSLSGDNITKKLIKFYFASCDSTFIVFRISIFLLWRSFFLPPVFSCQLKWERMRERERERTLEVNICGWCWISEGIFFFQVDQKNYLSQFFESRNFWWVMFLKKGLRVFFNYSLHRFLSASIWWSLSLSHTHTHTHTLSHALSQHTLSLSLSHSLCPTSNGYRSKYQCRAPGALALLIHLLYLSCVYWILYLL